MKKLILIIACLILLPVLAFAGPTTATITSTDVSGGNARIKVEYVKDGVEVGSDNFYVSNQPALILQVKQLIAARAKAYDDAVPVDQAAKDAAAAIKDAEKQAKIDALAIKKGDSITAADLD